MAKQDRPLAGHPRRAASVAVAAFLVSIGAPMISRAADTVPVPWNGMDIGAPTPPGSSQAGGDGTFVVGAGGADSTGTSDAFHFVYQTVTGDFALVARVPTLADSAAGTAAGLMVRDALASNVNFVSISATRAGATLQYREPWLPATGAETVTAAFPVWIRLVKRGTTVEGYVASDTNGRPGQWKPVGNSEPIPSGMLYTGLCLTSHAGGGQARATFDHVTLTAGTQAALDNGTYTIAPESAQAMTLAASGPQTALAAPSGSRSQAWVFTDTGGGAYSIQSKSDPMLALTVAGGASAAGTKVTLQPEAGTPAQRWTVIPNGNGTFSLAPQCAPGSGLDDFAGNGTPQATIDIWDRWAGDPHTQWVIAPG